MEIRILIDKSPGTMARVVTNLRRLGMTLDGQRLTETEEPEHSELTVEAQGPISAGEISEKISEIKGVVRLLNVGESGTTSASSQKPRTETASDLKGNVVDQIVAAYPKILRYVDAFESGIKDPGERSRRLVTLGEQVGIRMMQGKTELDGCDTIRDALAVVIPILRPIADAQVIGPEVHVSLSVFTRRQVNTMDLVFGSEASKCDFLTGFIQGLINCAPMLPQVQVSETTCRTNGDDECVFRVA